MTVQISNVIHKTSCGTHFLILLLERMTAKFCNIIHINGYKNMNE